MLSSTRCTSESHPELQTILEGNPFSALPANAVQFGDIRPPFGEPKRPDVMGYGAMQTLGEAVDVARRARTNESSEIRQMGFTADTPIYFARVGKPAALVNE